jgi:hypothetical protein
MSPEARAERLLRWYPIAWRDRYGEEFADLLVSEIEEQPSSWRRTLDVARSGLVARCSLVGLGGGPLGDPRMALAATAALMVAFSALAVSLWTQLATAAHSMPLDSRAAHTAMVVLTAALALLALLAILAAVPIMAATVAAIIRRERRGLLSPLTVALASLVALAAGGRHMAAHWTSLAGTGHGTSAIPDRVASLAWGETFTINTAWAHPHELLEMNLTRVGWMAASPLALVALLISVGALLHRLEVSGRVLRYEAGLAEAAMLSTIPMLAVASWWVISSQHAAIAGLRAGSLDLVLIAVMAAAAAMGRATSRRIVTPC